MARTKKTMDVQLRNVSVLTTDEGFAFDAVTADGRRVFVHMDPIQMVAVGDRITSMTKHAWVQDRITAAWAKIRGVLYADKL